MISIWEANIAVIFISKCVTLQSPIIPWTRETKSSCYTKSVWPKNIVIFAQSFSQCNYTCSVGSKPTFWQADPSRAFWWGKPSWAFFRKRKSNRAKLFAFKTEPNWAFSFPNLSIFWQFSVDFFKECNLIVERAHYYWCLQDYTLENWQKCWKSAHYLFFKVTWFFEW